MARNAVGLIKDILSACKLIRTAVRRRTGLVLVLARVAVSLVVADPAARDAATVIALKVVRGTGAVPRIGCVT